tara:strand:- start:503 stop:1012 length:510 start_codon:yes stop_codon:yes gene_type:complete
MKLLLENWRKYINEHVDDVAWENEDDKKLIDVFWSNGAMALQLAEMTGNEEMTSFFKNIMEMMRNYISDIDKHVSGEKPVDQRASWDLEKYAEKIISHVAKLVARKPGRGGILDWGDMLIEAGDYIWYGVEWSAQGLGTSAPYNIASKERSTMLYNEIKEWMGEGGLNA